MMYDSDEFVVSDEDVLSGLRASGRSSLSSRRRSSNGSSSSRPGSNITVEETASSSSDSLHPPRSNLKPRRAAIISSDSEEDELDQRALSPATRMSITGVRPEDLSDESSEIDYSDEEEQPVLRQSKTGSGDGSANYDKAVNLQREEDAAARYREATGETDDNHAPRYTTQFVGSIEETLHSTLFPAQINESLDSDVVVLSNRNSPILLSSTDSDASYNKENLSAPPFSRKSTYTPRNSAGAKLDKKSPNLVQPTIDAGFKRSTPKEPRRSRIKSDDAIKVSKEFHQKELLKLMDLKTEATDAQKLFEKVANKLPDKGAQIQKRIESLRRDIDIKTKYLSSVQIEPESSVPVIKVTKPRVSNPNNIKPKQPVRKSNDDAPDWDELNAAVNQIQPTHTGSQGMATFNTQKALTVDRLKDLHGSLKGCPSERVLADDPSGLKVTLMDHQKHALAWMHWREQQKPRGGILADDMGLGKTLTMISSVLACKYRQESGAGAELPSDDSDDDRGKKRKSTGGWTSKGRRDTYKGGTLVVCPASLLRQWESEVNTKVSRHKLTVCVHHGNNRETRAKHLRTYDIVVTTYNIVAREHKSAGAVFGVKWRRIILDEAHVVRNHKAQSSMAVCELPGVYRWALTGTPIQNKELDVFALLKFLRCSPFDDLATWKKWIDNKSAGGQQRLNMLMKSLMLRRTKEQLQLAGKLNSLPKKEIRLIEVTLDTDEMNVYQRVMTYSRTLFAQFLFQRAEKDSDLNFISDAQKPTYNQIKDPNGAYYKMHEKFSRMYNGEKSVKSHEILVLLLRLRQICCHPGLIHAMLDQEDTSRISSNESYGDAPEIDLLAQLNKLAISESTSPSSSRRSRHSGGRDEARIAKASQNVLKRSNPVFDFSRPSTKMLKVMEIVKDNVLKKKEKAIIVSQWTEVLKILNTHLQKAKIETLSLNGEIPVSHRQGIVNEFNDATSSKRILLLSLTAGGVGLNLIGANHLLLIDLHWNPQLEAQAQDRIYRVGQKKDVIIYKLMCLDTVEQRIKALQEKKLELAKSVLTGAKVSTKLTIDDLKGLFGM